MPIGKGSAQWNGGIKDGKGTMKPAHAPEAPFALGSRFEGQPGSSPEELLGAALSGCFSMALSMSLEQAGAKPTSIRTNADVHLDKDGPGWSIKKIDLNTEVTAPGLDAQKFEQVAQETKKQCPVSKVLAGATITLTAKLA